ncbi:uncharacterized protein LOC128552489 [Mercenaria mercenaria]|uniref:uncharacterized protein LOC128552489 n=1 Tax=Mercenaria mercenaria TaxID=6596 RepID=UPI00234ED8E1|nr:uncharacterized protein LOC128552489 [Mercenaria mercenaria]
MEENAVLFRDGSISRAYGTTFESSINITDICEGIQGIIQGLTRIVPIQFKNASIDRDSFVTLTLTPLDLRLKNTIHPRCSVRLVHETAASFISKLVIVNQLLICPQIELLKHEYIIDNASDTLQLVKNKIQVENYFIRDRRVRICLADFNTYLEVTVSIPLLQRIYKVVDNVCTILSLFCLLITFITYCVFRSLRNVPGINNMSLTISLFCAQLTLKLGIWQPVDSTFCPVFGILIHLFWLSTFFAMNVCSFHMYRVFSSNIVPLSKFTRKTNVLYLLYTYFSPTGIVLLTIGSHLAMSEGHSFGYGEFLLSVECVVLKTSRVNAQQIGPR